MLERKEHKKMYKAVKTRQSLNSLLLRWYLVQQL